MAKAYFSTHSHPDTTGDTSAEIIPFPVDPSRRSARARVLAILAESATADDAATPENALAELLGAIRTEAGHRPATVATFPSVC